MPPSRLMQKRKQDSVAEIAAVALDLFQRNGFDATKVEDIAAEAGCSPRTFYRYFGSKEDVVFHDLPNATQALGEHVGVRLAAGEEPWSAVTEALVEFIARFDATDQRTAIQRMDLWLHEPALKARYLQYVALAEEEVLHALCRHRRTDPTDDDLSQLMSVAAVGAYRIVLVTHHPKRSSRKLEMHLRDCLATLAHGFDSQL